MNDPIVGIDLGTSNTVVAACDEQGNPRVLADDAGYKIQPSVVSFHPNGSVIVGAEAKQRKVIDPRNTVYSVKRLIGRSFKAPEIALAQQRLPFQIKEGVNQQPVIVTRAGEFAIPEISAIVLDRIRSIAVKALGADVTRAVVTVPANFVEGQRSATATSGAIAGLTVVRVLNEPTAAALAYGHQRRLNKTIAVYDFGGGTFDVTIMRLEDQVFEVLGTAGDSFLGGDDLDERLVEHMVGAFLERQRIDLREHEMAMMRLRAVAEQTKIELSRRSRAIVKIDEIAYGPGGAPIHLEMEISRDELVARCADVVERTFPVCQEALRLAQLGVAQIDDVVLVGGTTKMPYVRDRVNAFFGRTARTDVNPEEAVAAGAALQAHALQKVLSGKRATARTSVPPPAPPLSQRPPTTPLPLGASGAAGRTTLPRIASDAGTEVDPTLPEGRRTTSPMGVPVPARPTTERAASRGATIDRLPGARPGTAPGAALGRITRPGPPPVPGAGAAGGGGAGAKTILGVPAAPLGGTSTATTVVDVGDEDEVTRPAREAAMPELPEPSGPTAAPTLVAGLAASAPTLVPVAPSPAAAMPTQLMGAADSGPATGPQVLDVTPRGLGIGTVAGYCEELIRRNARLPTQVRRTFTTSRDRQEAVRIRVCQGESRRLDDNLILGDLVLEGLEPRPRGETTIEVTFTIDHSGILQVHARDPRTGQERRASLDVLGAQSPAEVDAARRRLRELRG